MSANATSIEAPRAAPAGAAFRVEVETKADTFFYDCRPDQTLLGAGIAAGYVLPYGCATGTCGTCRARVMDGEVDPGWVDAPGYRRLKRDKGDVLLCQARPRSACSLKIPVMTAQPSAPTARALDHAGRVVAVHRLTRDVIEIDVELPAPMRFDPGQFVTARHASVDGARALSMVTHGRDLDRLRFVIKRKPGGRFSELLFGEDAMGAKLDLVGPLGVATFRPDEDRDFLCIAGGSGIAGMMAMLECATALGYFGRRKGHLFFGVRTIEDAFYVEDFARHVAAGNGALDVTVAISDADDVPAHHPDFPDVKLARGFVHDVAAASLGAHGEWKDAIAFVAGPQPMVDAAIGVLVKSGIGPQSIRFDKFS